MNRFSIKFAHKRDFAKLVLFPPKKNFRGRASKITEALNLQFQAKIKDGP
jgi:hypothetical protein